MVAPSHAHDTHDLGRPRAEWRKRDPASRDAAARASCDCAPSARRQLRAGQIGTNHDLSHVIVRGLRAESGSTRSMRRGRLQSAAPQQRFHGGECRLSVTWTCLPSSGSALTQVRTSGILQALARISRQLCGSCSLARRRGERRPRTRSHGSPACQDVGHARVWYRPIWHLRPCPPTSQSAGQRRCIPYYVTLGIGNALGQRTLFGQIGATFG
jgi:hypothetical protein